jgi:anti-anti-sigma factor
MEPGKAFYAQHNKICVLKLVGKIRYTISADIDHFLTVLFRKNDFEDMLIDLSETKYIDSTNLGLLAKAAKFMQQKFHKKITIIAGFQGIIEILNTVGFDNVFLIIPKTESLSTDLQELPHVTSSERESAKMILEAHKLLMELSSRNKKVFLDIVEILEKEYKKMP